MVVIIVVKRILVRIFGFVIFFFSLVELGFWLVFFVILGFKIVYTG